MRTRRNPRCTLCTKHRWKGNRADRFKPKEQALKKAHRKEMLST